MTVVSSELDIWNLALTRVGHEPLSSLTEKGKSGDRCRLHYPVTRDTVLTAHPWNFAIRRAALAQLAFTPQFEFQYAHALPTVPFCLRVLRTEWEANGYSSAAVYGFAGMHGYQPQTIEWRIETVSINGSGVRALLCNESEAKIEYIARIDDVALFSALFVDALAARLAAEVSMTLTDNQSLTKTMLDMYTMKMAEARIMDAMEGSPRDVINTDGWLIART